MTRVFDRGIVVGLGLVTALLFANAIVSYRNTRQLNEDAGWVAHTREVIDALDDLLSTVKDAETAQRGYLLTEDEDYLKPYLAAKKVAPGKVEGVARLTHDNAGQQARIPRLRVLVKDKLDELRRTVELADDFDLAGALKVLEGGEGLRLMRELRDLIGRMREDERLLLDERRTETEGTYRTAVVSGLLAALSGLGAVVLFVVLLRRHLLSRAAAAAVLHESHELLRATLSSVGDGLIATDAEGRVTFLNPVAETLTGWPQDKAAGQPLDRVFRIVNESTRRPVENPALRALAEGVVIGLANHTVLISRDGKERPIDDSAAPILDANRVVTGAVLVFRDVADRRQLEAKLRDEELRWRTLAEALPHLVWTDTPDGQCDYLSSQWGTYTGIPECDLLGLRWLESLHPDDRERTLACWNAACKGEASYDLEYRIRRHDGEYRWFKTRGVPVRDAEGKIVKWFGTCTDIHNQLRAEESLREADRRKDEFLALLGHELRNPLAPIRNAIHILRLKGDDPGIVARTRDMIDRQTRQMVRLVDELLDASRIARGKIRLTLETLDLAALARTTAEDHQAELEGGKLTLTVDAPERPITVRGDSTRLAQAVGNLIHNSGKFTDPGGRVVVRVTEENGEAVVSVSDSGIGIDPAALPGLFEAFHQVNVDAARTKGGLGLGLAVVKGLIELHGGRVAAASDGPGRGSTFTLRLPVNRNPVEAVPTPSNEEASPAANGEKVLIIEDGHDTAESLKVLLEMRGFSVTVAHNGPDGVAAARRLRPDAVVCDLGLPGMTGFEVATALRADPATAEAVLLCVTGYGQEDDRRRALEAGFDALLVKPADTDEVARLLTRKERLIERAQTE